MSGETSSVERLVNRRGGAECTDALAELGGSSVRVPSLTNQRNKRRMSSRKCVGRTRVSDLKTTRFGSITPRYRVQPSSGLHGRSG